MHWHLEKKKKHRPPQSSRYEINNLCNEQVVWSGDIGLKTAHRAMPWYPEHQYARQIFRSSKSQEKGEKQEKRLARSVNNSSTVVSILPSQPSPFHHHPCALLGVVSVHPVTDSRPGAVSLFVHAAHYTSPFAALHPNFQETQPLLHAYRALGHGCVLLW